MTALNGIFNDAVSGAVREMRKLNAATQPTEMSDADALRRYERFHRGNAKALIAFAARNAPPGADALREAARYEAKMEALIKERNNGY